MFFVGAKSNGKGMLLFLVACRMLDGNDIPD